MSKVELFRMSTEIHNLRGRLVECEKYPFTFQDGIRLNFEINEKVLCILENLLDFIQERVAV